MRGKLIQKQKIIMRINIPQLVTYQTNYEQSQRIFGRK